MTRDEAMKICSLIPRSAMVDDNRCVDQDIAEAFKEAFPEFDWRVSLNRTGEYSEVFMTVDPNDPREHYVSDGKCIHCGKTGQELGLPDRSEDY